jgi:hypothetical protein
MRKRYIAQEVYPLVTSPGNRQQLLGLTTNQDALIGFPNRGDVHRFLAGRHCPGP